MTTKQVVSSRIIVFLFFALSIEYTKCSRDQNPLPLINRELPRFDDLKSDLKESKFNLTVVLSSSKLDNDGALEHLNQIGFQPLKLKSLDANESLEHLNDDVFDEILKFSERHNLSVVSTREEYTDDGTLTSKLIFAHTLKILYEPDITRIRFDDHYGEMSQERFKDYIRKIQDYDHPSTVNTTIYGEDGTILSSTIEEFKPSKVQIINASMPVDMQLKLAEALKQTLVLQSNLYDKLKLLCQFLTIQFPNMNWQAAKLDGPFHLVNDVWTKVKVDNQTYTIWATKSKGDDDDYD